MMETDQLGQRDIEIIDFNSGEILGRFEYAELDKAYALAKEYESMGLEVEVKITNASQGLLRALGGTKQEEELLDNAIKDEIDQHS